MPEDGNKSPAPPVVPGQEEPPVEEWQTKARAVQGGGEAEGVQTDRTEVVIKYKSINKLRKALRDGGGLTAKRGVGEFHRGFTILIGKDLNLAAFDIIGLEEGDEIDLELAPIIQDALKASLEDERDIVVMARPPWIQARVDHPPSCCRRFWSRILCCCVARQRRVWYRRSRSLDRVRACITAFQGGLFKLFYRRAGTKKNQDIFLSYQDADRDIAKWMKKICERWGMSIYVDSPIDCVHTAMMMEKDHHEVQAVVQAVVSDSDEKENKDKEEGAKEDHKDKEGPKEEYMKRLLADPTSVQAPVKSVEHWLRLREETIRTSKIVVVVMSKEAADDAWILLDCLWAWQWGIPILPVKRPVGYQEALRTKQDTDMQRIRRRLRFLFGENIGQPDAGQGANRADFQTRIAQALTCAISGGRKQKKHNLPHGMTDALKKACKQLQKDANALEKTRDGEAEQTLLKDSKMRALTHAERLTPVSKFNAIMAGQEIDVQEDVIEARELTIAPTTSMKLEEAEEDDGEDGPEQEEKQRKLRLEQDQQAIEYAKSLQLAPATSERVYGVIATLATSGVLDSPLAERAMSAIRTITHTERGCRAVYQFGGIEAILTLLKSAGLIPEEGVEITASMVSADGQQRFSQAQALDHHEDQASFCERLFSCCKRKRAADDDDDEDGGSPDGSPGGSPGSGSPTSGSPAGSPSGSPKGERTMTFELARSMSNFGGLGEDEKGLKSQVTLKSLQSTVSAFEKNSVKNSSSPPPEGADLKVYIIDHCFSALRNVAAHSQGRKHEVFKYHGPKSAVRALQVSLYDKEAEASSRSCAALLRNLSEGSKGCVQVLADAGLLEVAETELKDCVGGNDVRRHILAMLQNMAADLSASTHIFLDGKANKWLAMCADALDKSIEDKDHRLTRQALGAVANFSLLTAAQDLVDNRRSTADAGSQPNRSPAVMKKAPDSREGSEGSDNEDAAPDSAKSASARSEGSAAKSLAGSNIEGKKEEDQSKQDSAASDKDGGTSTAGDDKSSSSSSSSDESSDGESSGGEKSEENSDDEKGSDHQEDAAKIEEEKQSEHGSWVPKSEQGSGSFAANDSEGSPSESKAYLQSVSTADEEVEESLERAMKKVSGDVVEGILRLVVVKRKARGILDDGSYDAEVAVAASAVAALSNFAQDTDVERFIGSMGGIETVLKSMSIVNSADFQLQAVRFFWNMTFSGGNQQRFVEHHGIESLIGMMEHFQEPLISHARLQEQACGVLRNLSVGRSGRNKKRLLKEGMVRVLCAALEKFCTDVSVCNQACVALRAICEGAPPAAVQAANEGAVASLVKVLKLTGSNFELTDNILQTLKIVLVARESAPPFAMAGGHTQSLEVISRFHSDKTILATLQVLACALGHLHEPDDKHNKESLKFHGASMNMSAVLVDQDQADGEEVDTELMKKQIEKLRTMPGNQMRKELLEQGIIPKIFEAMESFEKDMGLLEAAIGCLLNLVLEVRHHRKPDDKHIERKTEVGTKCVVFLRMLGKVAYASADKHSRDEATGLMATLLRLLAAVTSQPTAANALYKEQAGERALEYMQTFIDEPHVQTAGCAFLGNFCAAKFKIRQSVVDVGAIQQVCELLKTYRDDELVVEAACKLLKYLTSGEGIQEETERAQAVPRCFDVLDHHRGHPRVMTACLGLFWSLALQEDFLEELLRQEIVHKSLNIVSTNIADAKVVAAGGGLLRNLFTTTSLGTQASMQCRDEGGFKVLLEGLFLHSLPPVDEKEVAATMPKIRAGAVHGRPGQNPAEGEAAGGAQGPSSLLRQQSGAPQRQGSILRQGSALVQRQGSLVQRQGSMPQRQGSALTRQKSRLGAPNAKAAAVAAASAATPQIQKPKRMTEWKATEDSTAVGENVLAALRNLTSHTEIARSLADEIQGNNEIHELRLVIELHPNSAMLQYQGLDFLNQLLVVRRDIKPVVSGMSDHVMMMLNRHRKTPVSDIAELVLEAIN